MEKINDAYYDSRDFAEKLGKSHSNLLRKIKTYVSAMKGSSVVADDYFIEGTYFSEKSSVNYLKFLITEKGADVLNSNVTKDNLINFCLELEGRLEKEAIVPYWVVRNLKEFGNCAIDPERFKEHSRNEILEYLRTLGLDCGVIRKTKVLNTDSHSGSRQMLNLCVLHVL